MTFSFLLYFAKSFFTAFLKSQQDLLAKNIIRSQTLHDTHQVAVKIYSDLFITYFIGRNT